MSKELLLLALDIAKPIILETILKVIDINFLVNIVYQNIINRFISIVVKKPDIRESSPS